VTFYKACACGCGGEVNPKTPGRPARYIHGHNRTAKPVTPLADRFWNRVEVRGQDECWIWTGGVDGRDRRGRVWYQGRNIPASRAALLLSGVDVPDGAYVCHHCDNPPCVNPQHLYVGDAASNVADMDRRGRRIARVPHPGSAGERNHAARLTDQQVIEIRKSYSGRRGEQTAIAKAYGVTPALISGIVRGQHRASI